MEYPVIHTFLDELPMDQLVVIESISSVRYFPSQRPIIADEV